jgi:flagellar hook-associated protein 1 FlgK
MPISTFNGLNIALGALQAEQSALDTTSHNISNANTVGYSRQVAELEAKPGLGALSVWGMIIPGQTGQGVQVADIQRMRDQFNDNNLRSAFATQGEADIRQTTMQGVEGALPEPGDTGLQAAMSKFWTALQSVSTNPEDAGSRQALAQSVEALGQSFQNAAATLTQQRADTDVQANTMLDTINSDASQIATLNTSIAKLKAVGQNPNDLLDQRDALIDKLSSLGNVTVTPATNGTASVSFGGVLLVDPTTSTGLGASTPVTRTTFNPGYGTATVAVASGLKSGQLKGLLDAYTTTLNPAVAGSIPNRLDQLAISLHDAVNAQNEAGFDLTGTAGGPMFAGATITSASQLAVDPALLADPSKVAAASTSAGAPGDSSNMIAMIALRAANAPTGSVLGGKTFDDYYAGMVSSMGLAAQTATTDSTNAATVVNTLSDRRSQVSGVSLDEEMTNLLKFQHAYAAAGRAMSTMQDMLDTLVNMVH